MGKTINPSHVAKAFREEIRQRVATLSEPLTLMGILVADQGPSATYAKYTKEGCEQVGVHFDLRTLHRLEVEAQIQAANQDPSVHGVLVYYPVFGTGQDRYLSDLVDPHKDVEGLNMHWARCLYDNVRFVDDDKTKKAILPCTPLAIIKLLEEAGAMTDASPRPLANKKVTIFNRSEVVGRPLASMMSNDGATVFSFDIDGPQLFLPGPEDGGHLIEETNILRKDALAQSDIVVTGVPTRKFDLIQPDEIRDDAICLNFSTLRNFTDEAREKAPVFVPRVGPMTVTMVLRNTLRLYDNTQAP